MSRRLHPQRFWLCGVSLCSRDSSTLVPCWSVESGEKRRRAFSTGHCTTAQRRRFFEIGFRSSPSWSLILHSQQGLSDDGAPCCMELAEQCVAAMGRSRLLLWLGVASLHSLHGSTAGGHDISTRCHTLTTLPHSSSAASSSRGIEAAWADGGPKFTCSRR